MTRRLHPIGLLAVLLALMAQLGAGAAVARVDAALQLASAEVLCHDDDGSQPGQGQHHPPDCPLCPLCALAHSAPVAVLQTEAAIPLPAFSVVRAEGLPPPSTAPPAPHRPPNQPRAPPIDA